MDVARKTQFNIEPAANLVTITVVGDLGLDNMAAIFDDVLRDPAFRPGMHILWDVRQAVLHAAPGDPTRFTMHVRANRNRRGSHYRAAAVASDPQAAALAQVYKALASDLVDEVKVFDTPEAARAWLTAPAA